MSDPDKPAEGQLSTHVPEIPSGQQVTPQAPPVTWEPPLQSVATGPTNWQGPTPKGPAPGVEFAGFWIRLAASIIDTVILVAILIAGSLVAGLFGRDSVPYTLLSLLVFLVFVVYFPVCWTFLNGQTPGMKALGLRIVRDRDGAPINGGTAFVRYLGTIVSGLVLFLGFAWIAVDDRKRGWHDRIAGTVVVRPA